MKPWLDILILPPGSDAALEETIASLAAQTRRDFSVALCGTPGKSGETLRSAGIAVRSVGPPFPLNRIENWNFIHGQSDAEWLKPLPAGCSLKPGYVEILSRQANAHPSAQFIRCEMEDDRADISATRAPFHETRLTPRQSMEHFPPTGAWIGCMANVAYTRTAWRGLGGFSPQFPSCAALHLNVMLLLHHGIINVPEPLVRAGDSAFQGGRTGLRSRASKRFEYWLILRQAKNYCLASKLPWPRRGVYEGFLQSSSVLNQFT